MDLFRDVQFRRDLLMGPHATSGEGGTSGLYGLSSGLTSRNLVTSTSIDAEDWRLRRGINQTGLCVTSQRRGLSYCAKR